MTLLDPAGSAAVIVRAILKSRRQDVVTLSVPRLVEDLGPAFGEDHRSRRGRASMYLKHVERHPHLLPEWRIERADSARHYKLKFSRRSPANQARSAA